MDAEERGPVTGDHDMKRCGGNVRSLFVVVVALALLLSSCNGGGPSSPRPSPPAGDDQGNFLVNPGFEDGDEPWISLDPESSFQRTEELAHSGKASAGLHMRDAASATGARVYYLVQEIQPSEFPEVVRGSYRVETWKKGTEKQYLQFVVIVFGADNMPEQFPNHQIRYPLAGIESPPFFISNAYFRFLGKEEPVTGEWVSFEANVADDFQRLWGAVPKGFDNIRVLFEVRFDDKSPVATSEADVYYDDLYVGTPPG